MRAVVFIAVFLLLSPVGAAAVMDGSIFGGFEWVGGRLVLAENETGEYVSNIFEVEEGEKVDSLKVDVLLKSEDSEVTVSLESSTDDFDTVAGSTKFYIGEDSSTYQVEERLRGNYRRMVLNANGETEVLNLDYTTEEVGPSLLTVFGIFLLAAVAGTGIVWWVRKDE